MKATILNHEWTFVDPGLRNIAVDTNGNVYKIIDIKDVDEDGFIYELELSPTHKNLNQCTSVEEFCLQNFQHTHLGFWGFDLITIKNRYIY
jgi:hypothetical protein